MNRQIHLISRPKALPELAHFQLCQAPIPQPNEEEVLIRTLYLSVDPYMRGRLGGRPSSHPLFPLNAPISSDGIGIIIESKNARFKVGEYVTGRIAWAEYSVTNTLALEKVDTSISPITTALGILGMPGMTAYIGLVDMGQPKAGETIVISAAAGAVGSLVGQIAKLYGCRVVGITGSDEKTNYLTKELQFDAAVNYKNRDFVENLCSACPKGIDIYFDNVGGDITDQVMKQINKFARIVLCGQISTYNLEGPDIGLRLFRTLIVKSAMAKGFLVFDYQDRFLEAKQQLTQWLLERKIHPQETIVEGLENTPKAFLGLFTGANIGKQIVKL